MLLFDWHSVSKLFYRNQHNIMFLLPMSCKGLSIPVVLVGQFGNRVISMVALEYKTIWKTMEKSLAYRQGLCLTGYRTVRDFKQRSFLKSQTACSPIQRRSMLTAVPTFPAEVNVVTFYDLPYCFCALGPP